MTEEKRLNALARAIVEGSNISWRKKAMRICQKMSKEPPSRLATGKREAWEDWHNTLKSPDPVFRPYEFFNLLRTYSDLSLKKFLKQERESARSYEKMMSKAYLSVQLIELILELRGVTK